MRAFWRTGWVDGLLASVPVAAILLVTQLAAAPRVAQCAAMAAALMGVPWIVPAWVVLAALSSIVFVWLALHGHALDAMNWLGHVVLVAAVAGCHCNGALLAAAWRSRHEVRTPQSGLGDFLRRASDRGSGITHS
jgi:hypothetical protein